MFYVFVVLNKLKIGDKAEFLLFQFQQVSTQLNWSDIFTRHEEINFYVFKMDPH